MIQWAQLIGAGLSAYSNRKANKDNVQGQKDAMKDALAAVDLKNTSGALGGFKVNPDGSYSFETADEFQEQADNFLTDANLNRDFLDSYQAGGPTGAAESLFNQRVDPMRRQQAKAEALFDEQANARGLLGATETFAARGANTQGYMEAENTVYNKSYMDVQDIIDRYRARIKGDVSGAVDIGSLPMAYGDFALNDAANNAAIAGKGLEAMSGASTTAAESAGKFGTNFGSSIASNKFGFNGMLSQNKEAKKVVGSEQYLPSLARRL